MIVLIKLIAVTVIWVLGLKVATAEKMVLEKIGEYGKQKVEEGKKIFEAIIVCPWCMPSIHSAIGYFFVWTTGMAHIGWGEIKMYPIIVMGASFTSGMLWLIYETINRIHNRNDIQARYFRNVEKLTYWDIDDRKKHYNKNQNHGSKEIRQ